MKKDIESDFDEVAEAQRQANLAAKFSENFLMHRHRGVIDCGDHFVIYGNDGYQNDSRSRREAELVLKKLTNDKLAIGVSDEGCTWAIVLTDYGRAAFDAEQLGKVVWDAWMTACDEAQDKEGE